MNFIKSIKNFFTGEVNCWSPFQGCDLWKHSNSVKADGRCAAQWQLLLNVTGPCIVCPSARVARVVQHHTRCHSLCMQYLPPAACITSTCCTASACPPTCLDQGATVLQLSSEESSRGSLAAA